ncbi:amino acid ABC transporter ATP-binding protein [Microbacterium esteraromaticum]|uniref:Amino acid ABC transporter ATP-binding protein n=1 Tax=Microbacterium esteraromaticum TaxID=57043 RepID=A0A7D7WKA8_9MICO|nr:amino acid ABC transporter ATP-binding protein [Microbacterium esteraromaticum]
MGEKPTLWQRLTGRKDTRRALEVLKGVNLEVAPGEVVALIGSSGSGKSTLLRCINKLETIDSGRVLVNGHLVGYRERNGDLAAESARETARKRTDIGMVFQHFNLFANKTAIENVMAPLLDVKKMSKADARALAEPALALVGLQDRMDNYPSRLSGGQKQRVAIARAMAMEPSVLLFDEPTSALDPELVGEVLAVIKKIAATGTTMMIVTHEMQFAREIADRIVVMDGGLIVEQGAPETVFGNPQHSKTRALLRRSGILSTPETEVVPVVDELDDEA